MLFTTYPSSKFFRRIDLFLISVSDHNIMLCRIIKKKFNIEIFTVAHLSLLQRLLVKTELLSEHLWWFMLLNFTKRDIKFHIKGTVCQCNVLSSGGDTPYLYFWGGKATESRKSATINSLWQTTEPDNNFLPLGSKYHMTYVTHYLLLLLPNLLPLKLYMPCVCSEQTTSFLTWSIFEADDKNLSNCPPGSLQFPLILCWEISIKVSRLLMSAFSWVTCGLDLLVQDVETGIRTLFFSGFNWQWKVDY